MATGTGTFDSIPIIDLSLAHSPATKPALLAQLRRALLEVGFLYISNTGVPDELTARVVEQGKAFFDIPMEAKLDIEMKNAPSFLGYSRLGNEITKAATDWREQIDISTPHPLPGPDSPLYHNLLAPTQWPSATLLPSFRPVMTEYLRVMSRVSTTFTSLLAEAISLPPDAFERFFDAEQQHKLKIVKYPDMDELLLAGGSVVADRTEKKTTASGGDGAKEVEEEEEEAQGVGPHKDSMLTSYLLQASPQHRKRGLQVQNAAGAWVDVPPRPGTLVVAIGQGLEALTDGVCKATTHRVLSPARGVGPRFSIPFFQGVSYDATFESMRVPDEVKALKRDIDARSRSIGLEEGGRGEGGGARKDAADFQFVKGRWGHLGEATLANRVRSHPDVGERWYPDLLKKIRDEQAAASGTPSKGDKEAQEMVDHNEKTALGDMKSHSRPVEAH